MNTRQTAAGGTVTYYPWGLVHKAGQKYGSLDTDKEPKRAMSKPQVPEAEDEDL